MKKVIIIIITVIALGMFRGILNELLGISIVSSKFPDNHLLLAVYMTAESVTLVIMSILVFKLSLIYKDHKKRLLELS